MPSASSWKKVLVVRPQPGQAVTCGTKAAQAQRLQNLLTNHDLLRPGFVRARGQRGPDRVADALLQQEEREGGGRGGNALEAHPGLGQAQVQGVGGAAGELAIDRHQILDPAHLGREHDPVRGRPRRSAKAALCRQERTRASRST